MKSSQNEVLSSADASPQTSATARAITKSNTIRGKSSKAEDIRKAKEYRPEQDYAQNIQGK